MARRRRTGAAEDLMEIVARLPWWVGVALALLFYLLLHRAAGQQVVVGMAPGQIGTVVAQSLWKSLATFGQYIVPLLCLAGAGMSAWRRRQRATLVADVAQGKASDALDGMSWREFEALVGEAFRLQGYRVLETGGGGADGGVDLVLTRGGEKFLVQCKQWRAFKVGVDVVRQLYGVMAAKGATGGYVITSGRFTQDAITFAEGRNVKLLDGPQLHALIRQAQASRAAAKPTSAIATPRNPDLAEASNAPRCPVCSGAMMKRTAQRGTHAGQEFWGCSTYPRCRGTRSLS